MDKSVTDNNTSLYNNIKIDIKDFSSPLKELIKEWLKYKNYSYKPNIRDFCFSIILIPFLIIIGFIFFLNLQQMKKIRACL